MCGIAGLYHFGREANEADQQRMNNAVRLITHRGPDFCKVLNVGKSCLGHTRLSIIDLSDEANQPMTDITERYWLVYNGELFNYKTLRHELESAGVSFRTNSDTEVVLQSFIQYGEKCLERFNGFFAFAIYDQYESRIFCARDRFGIKPFYYSINNNRFVFGSELSAVKEITGARKLNQEALQLYFQLTYIPAPLTILEEIHKLEPGHYIDLTPKERRIESYYHWHDEKDSPPFSDAAKMVRSELTRSVQIRLNADVPLGTFLSGGIDSSIVSAIAAKHQPGLQTFSVGFPDSKFHDESAIAERVARHIGSNHHRIAVTNKALSDHVQAMIGALDEPFADSSALAMYILCKETATRVKVALSGDGADELFGGYRKHRALLRSNTDNWTNRLLNTMSPLIAESTGSRSSKLGNWQRAVHKYSKGLRFPLEQRYWNWLEWTAFSDVSALLLNPARQQNFENQIKILIDTENLNSILTADLRVVLPNDMLTKLDRMSMAHGIELRTPFLDHQLVEKVRALPFSYKCDLKKGKLLLREAFQQDLPSMVFDQPKKGFEIPVEQWLRTALRDELVALSQKQLIEDQSVFNHTFLNQIVEAFLYRGEKKWATTLWSFLVFQKWWFKHLGSTVANTEI